MIDRDDIIRMAREAGAWETDTGELVTDDLNIKRFAKLVAEAEREACAKVADEWVRAYQHPSEVIAKTIRSRGNT